MASTVQLVKKITDATLMVKNSRVNDIAKFAISKVKPAVEASVNLKEGDFSSRKGELYQ